MARAKAGTWFNLVACLIAGATVQLLPSGAALVSASADVNPAALPGAGAPGGALATAQARAKLQMARAQMAQFNFERAEQLAHEAERLQPKLNPGEDTPKKLLDDLVRVRTDPKKLLIAARVALGRKDYDRAEQFAKLSEKNAGPFTFPFWSDTPSKVLKDVQELRRQSPPIVTKPVPPAPKNANTILPVSATSDATTKPPATLTGAAANEHATILIKQARQALAAGDLAKAKKLNDQARALKPTFQWWEDNPEKVQSDIARAELMTKHAPQAKGSVIEKNKPLTKDEAVVLVKKGRSLLAENKIDEATRTCLKAKSATSLSWGLFEDSPEKLRQDIEKARVKRDREESVKVLAQARKLYEEGKYDEASKAAFHAQKLHGAYSIWEFGDRPERILADIQTAKIRIAKGQPVEVKKPADTAVAQQTKPAPAESAKQVQARQMLVEARLALQNGDTGRAQALAQQVKSMKVILSRPGDDSPDAVMKDVQMMITAHGTSSIQKNASTDNGKTHAVQLMAEAKSLQKAGKLLEAKEKVVEAQKIHAQFGPNEENPDMVVQQLIAEARWQVSWLYREAGRLTADSGPDMMPRFQRAEQALLQANTLAVGFGLDTQPLETKLQWVRTCRAGGPNAAQSGVTTVAATKNHGQELLDMARLEIQRGETANARKLAEEAAQGPYGVQTEAWAVLRSIYAEEYNQRRLQANRTFDAAMSAYNRRDFVNASNLIQTIDANNLDDSRKARLREIVLTPEMQTGGKPAIVQVQAVGNGGDLPGVPLPSAPMLGEQSPGTAHVSDDAPGGDALLKTTVALRQVKFQQLRQQGLEIQRDASEKFRTGQTDAAIDMLQDYIAQLNDSQLEPGQVTLLRRPAESRLQQFKLLKAQRDFLTQNAGAAKRFKDEKTQEQLVEQNKEKKVADLMKQYNTFFKDGKYLEAERLAMQAHELDPDNPMAAAAVSIAKQQYRITTVKKDLSDKERYSWEALRETDKLAPAGIDGNDIVIDKDRLEQANKRNKIFGSGIPSSPRSEKEREIEQRLLTPITLSFKDTPLSTVISDLRAWQGINIFVDTAALEEDGISIERPVTINLELVPMKSALNMLLNGAHLTWTIKDDVLQITTPRHAKGGLQTKTFPVADLVIPVPDFAQIKTAGPSSSSVGPTTPSPTIPTPTPYTGPRTLTNGDSVPGSSSGGSLFGADSSNSQHQWSTTKKEGPNTTEEALMGLIKNTIAPSSWSDSGGPGSIEYYPLGMSLIINQTPDIQEQVADLLAALRRLQDQEVAVEVRFISLEDSFFERIGVDFNMNIQTKNQNVTIQPQLTNGIFAPQGYINSFTPKNTLVGLQQTGTFTPDLSIPLMNNSFAAAVPTFGGYQPGLGGLQMGLAFLSNIQLFLFLEAVQGDTRNNVMQAPKLTLFNGQTSTVQVTTFQNFLTGVQVVPQMGLFTFIPQSQPQYVGPYLAIQAIISADRRFVRLNLSPSLTNLATSTVNLFPVVVPIFPQFDGTATGQPVVFTQYIQQPIVNTVSIQTTVAVPDGGTVLLGGLKLLSEDRKEYGPPILSNIPILSRLFKNTSYGRDAQSLLIMVTPRIIIQEEEEENQTGYIRPTQPTF